MLQRYQQVRLQTESLCTPLVQEDYIVQSMPDVSPTKWHLAHTSWFFETFLLVPHYSGYNVFDPHFAYLFNSYYVAIGDRHCRQNRGLLSRPTVAQVYAYRKHVDDAMLQFLSGLTDPELSRLESIIDIGLHHEQQHQELMLTDIKHVFWVNPLRPGFAHPTQSHAAPPPMRWVGFDGGLQWIGHEGLGFSFDNESPRHRSFLEPFQLGSRLVTNGEYKQFIDDGGYKRPDLWLSLGWATASQEKWQAPLYWLNQNGQCVNHTLSGISPVNDDEPVSHVSYFEADAYARWAGARLPSEFEWESASYSVPIEGNFVESGMHHPSGVATDCDGVSQMFGDLWEWTRMLTCPIPAISRPPVRWGSTTENSCATSSSFAADRVRHRGPTFAEPIGTSSRLMRGGNSVDSD